MTTQPAYYGQPILKPPTWTDLIPTYFFTGGLAGAAGLLSFAAYVRGDRALSRSLDFVGAAAVAVSGACLIKDLGKPLRFYRMLRVIKPTSPMSIGTYIFSAFSVFNTAAVASELLGLPSPLIACAKGGAALVGPALATYTAVLVSNTAAPAWHEARRSLPFLFASSALGSAAGAGLLFGSTTSTMPRSAAMLAAGAEMAALRGMRRELGSELHKAYETGRAGTYSKWARALTLVGAAGAALCGSNRVVRGIAGAALLAGALAERFAVVEAGRTSTRDPRYVLVQQGALESISAT